LFYVKEVDAIIDKQGNTVTAEIHGYIGNAGAYKAFLSYAEISFRDVGSVADLGCWSRNLIFVHLEPKTATKEKGEKKLIVLPFFCSNKYHKIYNYFIFDLKKKKKFS
jgi:hypothetical protein